MNSLISHPPPHTQKMHIQACDIQGIWDMSIILEKQMKRIAPKTDLNKLCLLIWDIGN